MSWGITVALLVAGIGFGHTSFAQAVAEPEFEFDQTLFSYSGEQEEAYSFSSEQTIVFTSWVILPAGTDKLFEPVSGHVQGWWDKILDDGPAGFLAGAGPDAEVVQWISRREPRAMYLNAQYQFYPHGTETRLEVKVTISGLDKKWVPGLEQMMDDFLQMRLAPFVGDIHRKATTAVVDFPGT